MLTLSVKQQVSLALGEEKRERESLPSRGSKIVIDLSATLLCVPTTRENQEKGNYATTRDRRAVLDLD
jgi:hypothetical protein